MIFVNGVRRPYKKPVNFSTQLMHCKMMYIYRRKTFFARVK